jgi:hypothetical protein
MNEENKRCHLNMIQQVIARMGTNSFSLKGWSVGMMIAIYAFAGQNSHKAVVVTLIPLLVFWLLDSYYLTLERKFRALYNDVRLRKEEIDFDMNFDNIEVSLKELRKYCFVNVLISKTVLPFYLVCIATTLVIYLVKF